jgi:hypothetical protein
MSLLNIRNLSAPIRSKIQLGGLIIAALLVLAIRLGGGSSSGVRQSADGVSNDERAAQRARIVEFLNDTEETDRQPAAQKGDGLLDELVDGSFDKRQKQKRQEDAKSQSFDEIRRSLGLE